MLVVTRRLPAHPASVAAARRAVDRLVATSSPQQADDARIVVSELVTTTLVGANPAPNGWIDLTLKVSRGGLRIEVRAGGPEVDRNIKHPTDQALSGPSRRLVERLTEDWGTDPANSVWAVLTRERSELSSRGLVPSV